MLCLLSSRLYIRNTSQLHFIHLRVQYTLLSRDSTTSSTEAWHLSHLSSPSDPRHKQENLNEIQASEKLQVRYYLYHLRSRLQGYVTSLYDILARKKGQPQARHAVNLLIRNLLKN